MPEQLPTLVPTLTTSGLVVGAAVPKRIASLLFPSDAAKWLEAASTLRSARPDQSGTVRFENVRPGDYLAVALDYVQQWQINDPEFLESLRDKATALRVAEGSNQHVALKIPKE